MTFDVNTNMNMNTEHGVTVDQAWLGLIFFSSRTMQAWLGLIFFLQEQRAPQSQKSTLVLKKEKNPAK